MQLPEIVAHQWAITTEVLLDDLERLGEGRVQAIDYGSLLNSPQSEMERLAAALGLGWDLQLGDDSAIVEDDGYEAGSAKMAPAGASDPGGMADCRKGRRPSAAIPCGAACRETGGGLSASIDPRSQLGLCMGGV